MNQKDELNNLALEYREQRTSVSMKDGITSLYKRYIKEREQLLLEIAASVVALDGITDLMQGVHYERITPQMEESFTLAFPNKELSDLEGMDGEALVGLLTAWKGKYFEVMVRDELNSGEAIGDIQLENGQTAVLADSPTQPGWDLQIVNGNGVVDEDFQLKATESLSYVKSAIAENPNIDVIATDEVFENPDKVVEQMHASGISDADLESYIENPVMNNVSDYIFPFSSFVIITLSEGRKLMMGKQSLNYAISNSFEKMVKSGISLGAGTLAFLLTDMGVVSIPTTIATRLGIDRYQLMDKVNKKMDEKRKEIKKLKQVYVY
ncbi:hypothetical protein ACFOUV_15595 [Oceanobacillus longus]|uniref:Uncharacterized protein n=1 Tax=Oceanobacillus longus TaxID=930120 RepID=A0ABV8GZE9_9BACI